MSRYYFLCKVRVPDSMVGDMEIEWQKDSGDTDGSFEMFVWLILRLQPRCCWWWCTLRWPVLLLLLVVVVLLPIIN